MARLVRRLFQWLISACASHPKECKDQASRFADWLINLLRKNP